MKRLTLALLALALLLMQGFAYAPAADDKPAVHMAGSAFAPDSLKVTAGTTVVFVNDDSMPHTVTADDKSFDSGNIAPGASWSHAFGKAGTYAYGCTYHSWMHGKIVVTAAP